MIGLGGVVMIGIRSLGWFCDGVKWEVEKVSQ